MKTMLRTVAPALLILLFAYATVSKLADFTLFRHEMYNQNFPPEVAGALVFVVPFAEIATIALLLTEKWQWAGLVLSAILMAVFTGYIGLVLAGYWQRLPCSCGGVLKNMSWRGHFVFNLFFLAISLAALAQQYKGKAENLRKE
nr:MauE/DoxX family redox-associated membrane protein [Mucilaginibacter sp. L294]